MNYNPTQIIVIFLFLSSSVCAQDYYPYTNWGGRIAGIVIGILIVLFFFASCCIAVRRRRSTAIVTKPDVPGTNAQPVPPYSLPIWQGAQTYAPPPGPPPGHPFNTASMNPYEFNEYPELRPPPPPYVKGGEGVTMPQEANYSSPPGPPPAAHTRENNRFV
ncbi:hypothetical protein BDR05DRAFT_998045 [Suillus weaverae]|nr:hypothetical protein BDR05DRAFT_998045 [Suillus weaverae]